MSYLSGTALFAAIVAGLYMTKEVFPEATYNSYIAGLPK